MKKIIVWGAGIGAQAFHAALGQGERCILGYVDRDPAKWGTSYLGRPVVAPDQVRGVEFDHLVVTCQAVDQVREEAARLGLPLDRLVPFQGDPVACLERLGIRPCLCSEHMELREGRAVAVPLEHAIGGKMLLDVAPPVPLEDQVPLAARLLAAYRQAADCAAQAHPLYRVGQNWGDVLADTTRGLGGLDDASVPALAGVLNQFCRHDVSRCIMGGQAEYERFAKAESMPWLAHNHRVWQYSVDPAPHVRDAAMPPIGNPYGVLVDGALINWNSFPNHWRAWNCLRLLHDLPRPVVAEIGGGFGGFAYFLQRFGRPVAYVNFDLPENLIISSYYLSMAYPEKRILLFSDPDQALTPALFEEYDILLMPNFMVPRLADLSVDFFINTISFSEMELSTVGEYLDQIGRTCRRYLYHENLAHIPPFYKGYPARLFPPVPGFRTVSVSLSRWMGLDAHSVNHTYLEHLLARRGLALE